MRNFPHFSCYFFIFGYYGTIMAIKSSHTAQADERPVSPKAQENENQNQYSLRPKKLSEYIGQEHIKKHLSVAIESAKIRNTALEHILFYGPP